MLSLWHDTVCRGDKHNHREAGKETTGVGQVGGLGAQGAMQTSAGASPGQRTAKSLCLELRGPVLGGADPAGWWALRTEVFTVSDMRSHWGFI